MIPLRANTAVTATVGPFLDSTDFVNAETALTIQKATVILAKNGAAGAPASADQGASDAGAPHDANGRYRIALDATDTNSIGRLRLDIVEAGALPVWVEFIVMEEMAYDRLITGVDILTVLYRGTVKGASANSVTLDSDASSVDDFYEGGLAFIYSGTGAGQYMRNIPTGYVGATKVLPIDPAWVIQPVTDASEIVIYAAPKAASVSEIAAGVDAAVPAVNVKEVNDVAVTGDGAGTPWGPA